MSRGRFRFRQAHIVVAERRLEQRHPRARVGREERRLDLRMALVQEVEGLRESKQDDQVNDAECEHVAGQHRVDHRHERPSQAYSAAMERRERERDAGERGRSNRIPGKEHQQEPTAGHSEHQNRFFCVDVADDAERNASQNQNIREEKNRLARRMDLLQERWRSHSLASYFEIASI